jgi:uncharacterized protein with NAD-binding domain and iron-sulfur cluster
VYPLLGRGTTGAAIRHLDAPTNEAWIQPWTAYLRALGVKLRLGQRVSRLRFQHGRITGAQVQTPSGIRHVQADHYVVAMPVEYARRLWTPAMMRAEPALRRMRRLGVGRYHGVSFFLREPANVFDGIVACSDSPWSVNFVTQQQLWRHDISQRYGDGTVHDKLSTVVANWEEPGILYGKPAEACTPDELARELWAQIQAANGELAGVQPHSWLLDDGLRHRPRAGHWQHIDRLVMPQVNTERYRPEARTEIPNLVLSGDYLKTPYEIANMESAAYSGRRAANAVLSASRSHETPAATIEPYRPPEWESMKTMDADRYARGEKNVLDQALPLDDIQALANTLSQP